MSGIIGKTKARGSGVIATDSYAQSDIIATGTVASGTWQGTAVAEEYGGTGQSSYAQGDILYADASNSLAKLGAGTSGQFLKTQGTGANPTWASSSGELVKLLSADFPSGANSGTAFDNFYSGTYAVYKVIVRDVKVTNDGEAIKMQFIKSDGSVESSGVYDRVTVGTGSDSSNIISGAANAAHIEICPNIGAATGENLSCEFNISAMQTSDMITSVYGLFHADHSGDKMQGGSFVGRFGTASTNFRGIQFFVGGGAFTTSGHVTVFGFAE